MSGRGRRGGFSLIELMVVVAVVGILASIAYPSYIEYVRKSRRAECTAVLVGVANAMERRYSISNTYDADAEWPAGEPTQCPRDGGDAFYNLDFAAGPTATSFTLQAVPTGSQSTDKCGTLTLDNTGLKGMKAGMSAKECW